jgi:dephospho-CoA kinase
MTARPRVVGLVGGMGSGKSAVARLFAERGAKIISGDELGHQALRQPEIREQVVRRFGDVLGPDGEIARPKLGALVFADPEALRALEALVHPWIKQRIREEIEAARSDPAVPLVVLDAAILLEAGWDDVCDQLIFVDVPRPLRLARLAAQRGWTEAELEARERAQMPLAEKARRAHHRLENAGDPEQLRQQVQTLLERLKDESKGERGA